jgi:hypothetical protein
MGLRDEGGAAVLVGSLPFLRMGEPLCIEMPGSPPDATARSAHIAGVNVEVDPTDGVPRLIVALSRRVAEVAPRLGRTPAERAARFENLVLIGGCAILACAAFLVGYLI